MNTDSNGYINFDKWSQGNALELVLRSQNSARGSAIIIIIICYYLFISDTSGKRKQHEASSMVNNKQKNFFEI